MPSLSEVSPSGNRLDTLRALRDELARWMDETDSARDRAALSLRFVGVLEQIEQIEHATAPAQGGTGLDELNARRAARQSGAARQA